jgi:hypothetical protein
MAKKAAAQNGRADLPVSQGEHQRICDWHACHYVKVMLDQIFEGKNETAKDAKDAKFLKKFVCLFCVVRGQSVSASRGNVRR